MPVYLAHHYATIVDAKRGDAIWSIVLSLSDDAHLTPRGATRKFQRVANNESHIIFEKNADLLSPLSQSRAFEVARAFTRNPVQLPSRCDDLYFATACFPTLLRMLWQAIEICVRF